MHYRTIGYTFLDGEIISNSNRIISGYIFFGKIRERLFRDASGAIPKKSGVRARGRESRAGWTTARESVFAAFHGTNEDDRARERWESRSRYVNYHRYRVSQTMNESLTRFAFSVAAWRAGVPCHAEPPSRSPETTGARRSLGRIFANWCKHNTVNGKNARRKTRAPCVSIHVRNLA